MNIDALNRSTEHTQQIESVVPLFPLPTKFVDAGVFLDFNLLTCMLLAF